MSFKYCVEKQSENHYVLPRVGSMKVEAHAFFSEALYEASEESMWQQLANGDAPLGLAEGVVHLSAITRRRPKRRALANFEHTARPTGREFARRICKPR